jgi:hypothetical protein
MIHDAARIARLAVHDAAGGPRPTPVEPPHGSSNLWSFEQSWGAMGDDRGVVPQCHDHRPMMSRRWQNPTTAHAGHRRGGFQPTRSVVIRGPRDPRRVVIRGPRDPRSVVDHPPRDPRRDAHRQPRDPRRVVIREPSDPRRVVDRQPRDPRRGVVRDPPDPAASWITTRQHRHSERITELPVATSNSTMDTESCATSRLPLVGCIQIPP